MKCTRPTNRTQSLVVVALCLLLVPAAIAQESVQLPEETEGVWQDAQDAALDLEYLRAARLLEDLPLDSYDRDVRLFFYARLAEYHANAFEFGEENDAAAVEYTAKVLAANAQHVFDEGFAGRFPDIIRQAETRASEILAEQNSPPRLRSVPDTKAVDAGESVTFSVEAEDEDDDQMTISCESVTGVTCVDKGDGEAEITVSADGYEPGEPGPIFWVYAADAFSRDSAQVAIVIKAPGGMTPAPLVRSLLVPGWGQISSGRQGIGYALLAGQVITLGASLLTISSYNSAVDDYEAALDRFNSASSFPEMRTAWQDVQTTWDDISSASSTRDIAIVAAVLVYGANVVDAVIANPTTGSETAQVESDSRLPRLGVAPNAFTLTWKW